MEVSFQTKEESKKRQQEEFLELSGEERFMQFLKLSREINTLFPPKDKLSFEERNKDNFCLIHKDLKEDGEMK